MNKKLLVIPTIVLSSALLLTGCTGKQSNNNIPTNQPSTSSSSSLAPEESSSQSPVNSGYVAPPSELKDNFKGYFNAPSITEGVEWEYYKSIGAKTAKEDPSPRSTSLDDWESARGDKDHPENFDKIFGEVTADVEQTALNVSAYLEKAPTSTLDDINSHKELMVNRYEQSGSLAIQKDDKTGFYFVIFTLKNGKESGFGILVPQKGITPDFNASQPK